MCYGGTGLVLPSAEETTRRNAACLATIVRGSAPVFILHLYSIQMDGLKNEAIALSYSKQTTAPITTRYKLTFQLDTNWLVPTLLGAPMRFANLPRQRRVTSHYYSRISTFSNRQPRIRMTVNLRKQTAGTRLNRQLSRYSRIEWSSGGILDRLRAAVNSQSRITSYGYSKQRRTCGKCEKTTDSRIAPQFPRSLLFSGLRALSDWQTTCPSA
jgi:hypothetical protein